MSPKKPVLALPTSTQEPTLSASLFQELKVKNFQVCISCKLRSNNNFRLLFIALSARITFFVVLDGYGNESDAKASHSIIKNLLHEQLSSNLKPASNLEYQRGNHPGDNRTGNKLSERPAPARFFDHDGKRRNARRGQQAEDQNRQLHCFYSSRST